VNAQEEKRIKNRQLLLVFVESHLEKRRFRRSFFLNYSI